MKSINGASSVDPRGAVFGFRAAAFLMTFCRSHTTLLGKWSGAPDHYTVSYT